MGIGRSEFLRLTGLALAGTLIDPLQAVTTHENIYINKKLGIMFNVPKNWGFIKIKDFGKLKEEQILNGNFELIKDEVYEELGDPICLVTKYYEDLPKYKGIFSPTITLNIAPKHELIDIEYQSFEELIQMSEFGASRILKDFKIIKRYPTYTICDCKFHEYDSEYLFEHVELKNPVKVNLKVLKAEHNDFYYDFNCHQSIEVNQTAKKEFEEFKKSIKLI